MKKFFSSWKKRLSDKKFLSDFNCNFIEVNVHKFDIQLKRYFFFLEILKKKEYKNILFCDSRDIFFQSNPFEYNFKGDINFSLRIKKLKIVHLILIG